MAVDLLSGWTTHGHPIPGLAQTYPAPARARCGGPGLCRVCSQESAQATNIEPELHPEDAAYVPKHMKDEPKHMDLESDTTIRVDFNLKISEVSNLLLHLNQLGYEFEASTKRR